MSEVWNSIVAALHHEHAMRAYFVLTAFVIMAASAFVAWQTSEYVTGGLVDRALTGRKPTTLQGWKNRLAKLNSIKNAKLFWQFVWLVVAVVFGAIVPAMVLLVIGLNADWLFMTSDAFLRSCKDVACVGQSKTEALVWYIASLVQTSVVADVFSQQIALPRSAITANPHHLGILSTIFAFRSFLQLYLANWLSISALGFWKTLRSDDTKIDKQIEESGKRIKELESELLS